MNVAFDFNPAATSLAELEWVASKSGKGKKDKKHLKLKKKCCHKPKHKRCKRCPKNA